MNVATADPGRVRVTRQSQVRDALSAFTLKTSPVGGINVSVDLKIRNEMNYEEVRLTLHTPTGQGTVAQLFVPVRLDRTDDGQEWKATLLIPMNLARQAELELLLYRPHSPDAPSPPPGAGIVYDIDLSSYIDPENNHAEQAVPGYPPQSVGSPEP